MIHSSFEFGIVKVFSSAAADLTTAGVAVTDDILMVYFSLTFLSPTIVVVVAGGGRGSSKRNIF